MTDTELQAKVNEAICNPEGVQIWDFDRVYMEGFYSFQDLIKISLIIKSNREINENT